MKLIRDIIILGTPGFFGGFLLSIAYPHASISEILPLIALGNLIANIIGFFIVGCLTQENKFIHLRNVAILYWMGTLINKFIIPEIFSLKAWFSALIFIFICMFIGGGLSLLFVPNRSNRNADNLNESFQTKFLAFISSLALSAVTTAVLEIVKQLVTHIFK